MATPYKTKMSKQDSNYVHHNYYSIYYYLYFYINNILL